MCYSIRVPFYRSLKKSHRRLSPGIRVILRNPYNLQQIMPKNQSIPILALYIPDICAYNFRSAKIHKGLTTMLTRDEIKEQLNILASVITGPDTPQGAALMVLWNEFVVHRPFDPAMNDKNLAQEQEGRLWQIAMKLAGDNTTTPIRRSDLQMRATPLKCFRSLDAFTAAYNRMIEIGAFQELGPMQRADLTKAGARLFVMLKSPLHIRNIVGIENKSKKSR